MNRIKTVALVREDKEKSLVSQTLVEIAQTNIVPPIIGKCKVSPRYKNFCDAIKSEKFLPTSDIIKDNFYKPIDYDSSVRESKVLERDNDNIKVESMSPKSSSVEVDFV